MPPVGNCVAGVHRPGGSVHPARRHDVAIAIDGVSKWFGIRWVHANEVHLTIRDELINAGGMLSGVVGYARVDYCMGSTLWKQTSEDETIATIGISINYVQTATDGDVVCTTELDRRNRSNAVLRSEVRHDDGRLLATAIGSYTIFERPDGGGVGVPTPEED